MKLVAALLALAPLWCALGSTAHAQTGFAVDTYTVPIGNHDGLFIRSARPLEKRQVMVRLATSYQNDLLIVETRGTGTRVATPVEKRVSGYASIAYGVTQRLGFYALLPITLWQSGDFPPLDTTALGDLTMGAQANLNRSPDDRFTSALEFELISPTGSVDAYSSDDRLSGRAGARFGIKKNKWRLGLNLGAHFRPKRTWLSHETGSELDAVAAIIFDPNKYGTITFEVVGGTGATKGRFATERDSHLELGVGFFFRPTDNTMVGAGASGGVLRGVGTPQVRLLLTGGFSLSPPP